MAVNGENYAAYGFCFSWVGIIISAEFWSNTSSGPTCSGGALDGLFNAQDINPFVVILTTGGVVPEPMTMGLLAMGGLGLILRRRRA